MISPMPRCRPFLPIIQDPWQDWDRYWLRDVGERASVLCIRVCGLIGLDHRHAFAEPADPSIQAWATAMRRILGQRKFHVASAILRFRHYPSHRDACCRGVAMPMGNLRMVQWTRTLPLHERLKHMLRKITALTQVPILLHVEDFSARWALESGFIPAYWVMDNPMVGKDEAEERWPNAMGRSTYLRRSSCPAMARWDTWRVHLKKQELLGSDRPLIGHHGIWSPAQPHAYLGTSGRSNRSLMPAGIETPPAAGMVTGETPTESRPVELLPTWFLEPYAGYGAGL